VPHAMPSELSPSHESISHCLETQYGFKCSSLEELEGGYDFRANPYKAVVETSEQYFVKVRKDRFRHGSLAVPRRMVDAGATNLLPPRRTTSGDLSCDCEGFSIAVFPFVSAKIAKERPMSLVQWRDLGKTMAAIHAFNFEIEDVMNVRLDDFDGGSLMLIQEFVKHVRNPEFTTTRAASLFAQFWHDREQEIENLADDCRELQDDLRSRNHRRVVCHSDCHLWNVLVADDGSIYLTDWDDGPVIAAKERDLFLLISPDVRSDIPPEESAFFEGYGTSNIDLDALTYYRIERKLEDLVVSGNDILFNQEMSEQTKLQIAEDLPRFLL